MGSITSRKSHLEAGFVMCKDLQEAGAGEPGTPRPGTPRPRTSAMPRLLLGQTASRPPRRKDKSRGGATPSRSAHNTQGRGAGREAVTLTTHGGPAKLQTKVRKWRNALSLRFFSSWQ